MVTAALLAEVGASLTEVAGQHEHQRIASGAWQRGHLDSWAGEEAIELAAGVRAAVREAAEWSRRLEELTSSERERRRMLDVLTYEIAEIEGAALRPGESGELAREAGRLERAEAAAEGISSAIAAITDEGGAQDQLASAAAQIAALAEDDAALRDLAARLESASVEASDVAGELARASVAFDPDALEQIHQRVSVLTHLQRKYGADEAEVLAYLEGARAKAVELGAIEEGIEESERRTQAARARARKLAADLTAVRGEAAPRLAREVTHRLESLGLGGGGFEVALTPSEGGEAGAEDVEYLVGFNPGDPPRPIRKVASGGELSRLALALNLAGTHGDATTLVFDEVDAGVGGEAARAVGAALAELAESTGRQVMVVTHLPQVAAFADAQYRIEKLVVDGRAAATVTRVEGRERIAELSRMLAGLPGSDRAHGHAEELLENAARRRLERATAGS
jgi:DNA repair protein RecN (Recombination protein N)